MTPTILIIFCWFLVHSKPNNMTLSVFPEDIPETIKILFNFLSPYVAPKPTDQSPSHSISRIPLQLGLSPALVFLFDLPSKLNVVHIRKHLKIFIFSKMAPTILIKFCVFIVHSKPNTMTLSSFPGKITETRKIVFNFLSVN